MTRDTLLIGAFAEQTGVAPDTLRYYERLGILEPAARSAGGFRLYSRAAADRLTFVRKAQALGLTLGQVREIVSLAEKGGRPCAHVRGVLERRLREIETRMIELRSLHRSIVDVLRLSPADSEEPCVCAIIDSQKAPKSIGGSTGSSFRSRSRNNPSTPTRRKK